MNAQLSLLRARMAPAALAAAIALAFGLSAPAQAQYTYPGTASSSGRAAKAGPVRAASPRGGTTSPRGLNSWVGTPFPVTSGNPVNGGKVSRRANGVRPVATGVDQRAMHSGSENPTSGYGARESYGSPQTPVQGYAGSTTPISASPVRAGAARSAMNYGPSQTSNANFRNSVSGKTSSPNMNPTGQPTSFTGPTGKQVNLNGMSNPSVTGPHGQVGMGGPDLNHLGGGYGHQKGAGMNLGGVVSAQNGSVSMKQTGGPPGVANGGPHFNNGGTAGVSDKADGGSTVGNYNDTHNPDGSPKSSDSGKSGSGSSFSDFFSGLHWGGGSKPDAGAGGSGSHRIPNGGPVDPNAGADGIDRKSGVKVAKDEADMGPTAGPGEIVSGTGQVVQPGKKKGQDTGGGQTGDAGTTNSGGRNAQGAYIAPSGQDNVKKPKEVGTLKMDYNGKNGAIDPKQSGVNGGGG